MSRFNFPAYHRITQALPRQQINLAIQLGRQLVLQRPLVVDILRQREVFKLNDDIYIAATWIEVISRRGAQHREPPHMVLPA